MTEHFRYYERDSLPCGCTFIAPMKYDEIKDKSGNVLDVKPNMLAPFIRYCSTHQNPIVHYVTPKELKSIP